MSAITSRLAPASPVPWRALTLVAALLLALVAGVVLVASGAFRSVAPPYGLAGNGWVAFAIDGDIVVADGPDQPARLLVGGAGEDRLPIFSPDGSRLVFLRGPDPSSELWTADADGGNVRRLTGPLAGTPVWGDWSPGGDLLALHGAGTTPGAITLLRTDGSGSSTIETDLAAVDFLAFRPTVASQLSFRGKDEAGNWGFYLINRDGSGRVRLALDPGYESNANYQTDRDFYFSDPAWDSTGTRFAYHTLEPDPTSTAGDGFRIHLADIDAQGTVTADRLLEFDPAADDEFSPMFIPETQDIVFRSLEGSLHRVFRGSTAAGAAAATDLGISARDWMGAVLSPDGTQLVVILPTTATEPQRLLVLDLGTLQATPVSLPVDFSWQRVAPSTR